MAFKLSDGSKPVTDGSMDMGGVQDVMPEGTIVKAIIEKAKWEFAPDDGPRYMAIQWGVQEPEDYRNFKVFQKIYWADLDPKAKNPEKKRDKAIYMIAAIDEQTGGHLGKIDGLPTDEQFKKHLENKMMVYRVGVWEIGDASGNWVQHLYKKGEAQPKVGEGSTRSKPKSSAPPARGKIDDDIPF